MVAEKAATHPAVQVQVEDYHGAMYRLRQAKLIMYELGFPAQHKTTAITHQHNQVAGVHLEQTQYLPVAASKPMAQRHRPGEHTVAAKAAEPAGQGPAANPTQLQVAGAPAGIRVLAVQVVHLHATLLLEVSIILVQRELAGQPVAVAALSSVAQVAAV